MTMTYPNNPSPLARFEPLALDLELPWVEDEEREAKFRRLMQRVIIAVIILITIMQFLPVLTQPEEAPDLIKTTLLLEPKEEIKEPEPEPIPEPIIKPKPVKKLATTTQKQPSKVKPKKEVSMVTSQGLDALSTQLASLSSSVDMQRMRNKNVTSSNRGQVAEVQRDRLGSNNVTQRSAGVVISDQVMRADVSQLSDHQTTEVSGLDLTSGVTSNTNSFGEIRTGERDIENIRRILEAAKSSIYANYHRHLVDNPDLAGKLEFTLSILPSGDVSGIALVSSELGIQELEQDILNHIKQLKFGQADVIVTTVNYTFSFVPG